MSCSKPSTGRVGEGSKLYYHRVPEFWRKEDKLQYLVRNVELLGRWNALNTVEWDELTPDERHTWLIPEHAGEFENFLMMGSKETKASRGLDAEAIFKLYSGGVKTNRDTVVFDFNQNELKVRIAQFIEDYNYEVDRYRRAGKPSNIDDFVNYQKIKWDSTLKRHIQAVRYAEYSSDKTRQSLYRPFAKQTLYFDSLLINSVHLQHYFFPTPATEQENWVICVSGPGHDVFRCLIADCIVELKYSNSANGGTQCFPFYVYDADGTNRRENITDWALAQVRARYAPAPLAGRAGEGSETKVITKWDIFYYVYALLHHPDYRERYADNLKRDLPRIPFAPDFWAFAEAGRKLADLHLNYETVEPYELQWVTTGQISYTVEKMRLNKEKTALKVNDTLTLEGIPPQVFDYRLGNRSALDWVIDQYRVKTDKRSGITSDPNGYSDDERYIVDLVEKVVRVSLETVAIVDELAALPFRV